MMRAFLTGAIRKLTNRRQTPPPIEDALAAHRAGKLTEAAALYEQILACRPKDFHALHLLGVLTMQSGRAERGIDLIRRAIAVEPNAAIAHFNLGKGLQSFDRHREALPNYDRALTLQPVYPEALIGRGSALQALGRYQEARTSYEAAVAQRPGDADANWNLGLAMLTLGELEEGWRRFEWRKQLEEPIANRTFPFPQWTGREPIAGKSIFVHWEQGFGDTIQFCRYALMLQAMGARVTLAVQDPLVRLLRRLHPAIDVTGQSFTPPWADYHSPLMSLPMALGTTLDTIPEPDGYLRADEDRTRAWRARLDALQGLKVGLVWAGGSLSECDRRRSVTLAALAPLADVPGVSWVSLQKGPPAREASAPPPGMTLLDPSGELGDFDDTAALVAALDLVIAVDTAVAHLAGALGIPVWILNRFDTCWRWMEDRTDSPWYRTARLFRQRDAGQWGPVIAEVRRALIEVTRAE